MRLTGPTEFTCSYVWSEKSPRSSEKCFLETINIHNWSPQRAFKISSISAFASNQTSNSCMWLIAYPGQDKIEGLSIISRLPSVYISLMRRREAKATVCVVVMYRCGHAWPRLCAASGWFETGQVHGDERATCRCNTSRTEATCLASRYTVNVYTDFKK